jgi:Domain of unknown function (DUF4136)
MRISYQLIAISILSLMPLASLAQEVVPYANREVKVDWVRGTDFSKYKTYAWGTPNQKAPDPNHPLNDIEAALQAKGLHKVGMDANPDLLVTFRVGNKQVYVLQNIYKDPFMKQGTLVVELADPQLKKNCLAGRCGGHTNRQARERSPYDSKGNFQNVSEVSPTRKK